VSVDLPPVLVARPPHGQTNQRCSAAGLTAPLDLESHRQHASAFSDCGLRPRRILRDPSWLVASGAIGCRDRKWCRATVFTQKDPQPLGAGSPFESAYAYTGNQPTVMTDPSGLRSESPARNPIDDHTPAPSGVASHCYPDCGKAGSQPPHCASRYGVGYRRLDGPNSRDEALSLIDCLSYEVSKILFMPITVYQTWVQDKRQPDGDPDGDPGWLNFRTDGCSGPVADSLAIACVKHDFGWRNWWFFSSTRNHGQYVTNGVFAHDLWELCGSVGGPGPDAIYRASCRTNTKLIVKTVERFSASSPPSFIRTLFASAGRTLRVN
jgi:hypothetical protein